MYQFIDSQVDDFPLKAIFGAMAVSRSAFYAYRQGATHQASSLEQRARRELCRRFWEHRRRYGSRRLHAEFAEAGLGIGRHRIRRWMQEEGLKAIQPRSFVPRTTDSRHTRQPSPNLLLESSKAPSGPNQVLVGDITYVPLRDGQWAYLATWMDLYSRLIVGWHLDTHMRTEIILNALKKAERRRLLKSGLIIHSDRGSQYASQEFRKHLKDKNYNQSMARKGDSYDNAYAESFFSRLKGELIQDGIFDNLEDAHTEIFQFIDGYYNPKRRHSALRYLSPENFEKQYFLT